MCSQPPPPNSMLPCAIAHARVCLQLESTHTHRRAGRAAAASIARQANAGARRRGPRLLRGEGASRVRSPAALAWLCYGCVQRALLVVATTLGALCWGRGGDLNLSGLVGVGCGLNLRGAWVERAQRARTAAVLVVWVCPIPNVCTCSTRTGANCRPAKRSADVVALRDTE